MTEELRVNKIKAEMLLLRAEVKSLREYTKRLEKINVQALNRIYGVKDA